MKLLLFGDRAVLVILTGIKICIVTSEFINKLLYLTKLIFVICHTTTSYIFLHSFLKPFTPLIVMSSLYQCSFKSRSSCKRLHSHCFQQHN